MLALSKKAKNKNIPSHEMHKLSSHQVGKSKYYLFNNGILKYNYLKDRHFRCQI